ncbi:MAG: cellulase family glycosylhydrolase [Reichenbachiella sp.]
MKITKIWVLLICVLVCSKTSAQTAFTGMRDITGLELTAEMAPGVNLYNTLDAVCWWCDGPEGLESETVWGQPYTTPEMVQAIADRGFKSLRIPVSWFKHMGPAPDYTIDEEWMDRVEEVANYAFDANMYAIINIHHDDLKEDQVGSWVVTTQEKQSEVSDQLEKVWTQIANRFKDYGDYLVFETMNEPREVGSSYEWNGGSVEHRDVMNALNLAAVNAIRATEGNNASRFIMVPQVGANVQAALGSMIIPNDDLNVIVSVHSYNPYRFCLEDPGVSSWGTDAEKTSLRNEIKSISDHFAKNGQAVVLGEWGAQDKDNLEDRIDYYEVFARACSEGGVTPISWIYSFDRNALTWKNPELEDAILEAFDPDNPILDTSDMDRVISVYPNPAQGLLSLSLSGQPSVISMYAFSGQQLLSLSTSKTSLELDLTDFESGIYMLRIQMEEKMIAKKIIIQ